MKVSTSAMQMACSVLETSITSLAFYRCKCGNLQPFTIGRGKPNCESCGRKSPRKKKC